MFAHIIDAVAGRKNGLLHNVCNGPLFLVQSAQCFLQYAELLGILFFGIETVSGQAGNAARDTLDIDLLVGCDLAPLISKLVLFSFVINDIIAHNVEKDHNSEHANGVKYKSF